MFRAKLNNYFCRRRELKKKRQDDRDALKLEELVGRDIPISDYVVRAVVDRCRTTVIGVLAETDPVYLERALTFSQEGEDLILGRIFAGRSPSFFVDIGAHHPFRFSNTFLLYRAGWRGINVDATPGAMDAFARMRPEDTNLECFVGDPATDKTFICYNEPALNTASKETLATRDLPSSRYWPESTTVVHPRRLSDILDQYKPGDLPIALLNLDVEGSEQEVLETNDWSKYRPEIIVIEQLSTNIDSSLVHPTTRYLNERGYRLIAKAFNSSFFQIIESE